jgi:hypothetical protein
MRQADRHGNDVHRRTALFRTGPVATLFRFAALAGPPTFLLPGDGAPDEFMVLFAKGRACTNLPTANHVDAPPRLADDPPAISPGSVAQKNDPIFDAASTILWHVGVIAFF